MAELHMRADIVLKMKDGESREEAEDRIVEIFDALRGQGLYLIGWTGETEVTDTDKGELDD